MVLFLFRDCWRAARSGGEPRASQLWALAKNGRGGASSFGPRPSEEHQKLVVAILLSLTWPKEGNRAREEAVVMAGAETWVTGPLPTKKGCRLCPAPLG